VPEPGDVAEPLSVRVGNPEGFSDIECVGPVLGEAGGGQGPRFERGGRPTNR
jgi:hypothetical protein